MKNISDKDQLDILRDNDKILYLDISANKVNAVSLKALLKLQADNYIKL